MTVHPAVPEGFASRRRRLRSVTPGMDVRLVAYDDAVLSDDPVLRLKAHTLSALAAVIPLSVAVFIGVDRRHTVQEGIALQPAELPFSLAEEWRGYVAGIVEVDPFAAARVRPDLTVARLDDFPVEESWRYRRYLDRLRMADRADVYLRVDGAIAASIALLRAPALPRFGGAETAVLRRLQPLIEHAYACAGPPVPVPASPPVLSEREAEVARLVAKGASNADVGRALHVSEATVKTHLTRVYAKLGVRTRTQLALALGGSDADPASPVTTFG